jgi:hypothetical protein
MNAVDAGLKGLLTVTAAIEGGTGLLLVAVPSILTRLLFGSSLEGSVAVTVARLAGVALVTLTVACWLARRDGETRAVKGLVAAMVLYNAGATILLAHAGLGSGLSGICLWPAVLLHAVLTGWCVVSVNKRATQI